MDRFLIRTAARLIKYAVLSDLKKYEQALEQAAPNPTKPYKPRLRLKQDPINMMRRRLYKLTLRDPKIQRQKKLTRKAYTRKNKQLLKRRAEFVRKAKKRLPPRPGTINTKRTTK